ncbi:MAG: 1-acyl-sn-glycerol-3-phosphate acyltransferase [Pseudonocardiales bacterium]|nr:1-acyl-sn-glycerol-3-phosphate acyltransferase [Pseudonocardiales bacterium]MBV9447345.1 1-acyl-sn-glycerol-3-phosphate acyltransferase [Streptosporangiaceae bacterium]MBV9729974.1 1-acyl-sn-glycerol-3-phosphate acyltransferase [Pseudonocardiales bacterium]
MTGLGDELRLLRHGRGWRGQARVPRSAQRWKLPDNGDDFPTAWARTTPAKVLRTALQQGVLKPVIWSQTRPVVHGREYLDSVRGPAIFVANHSSHLDTPLILGALPRRITENLAVGAAADYFFDSRAIAAATTLLFNAFPVDRRGLRRGRSLAAELVDGGWSLLLYPEGGRTVDGWLTAFKLGAAQLCAMKEVPAVPIALRGTFAAMPRGRRWPRPGRPRVTVRIGRPLRIGADETVPEFRTRLVRAVATLWAEGDLGWYRALRAAADDSLALPIGSRSVLPTTASVQLAEDHDMAPWRRIWEATRPPADDGPRQVWTD